MENDTKKPLWQIVEENSHLGRFSLNRNFPQYTIGQYGRARRTFLKETLAKESSRDDISKIERSRQNALDRNRLLAKIIRDNNRVDAGHNGFLKSLNKLISERVFIRTDPIEPTITKSGTIGVIHLTDWHLGETVNINGVNTYDFNVAAKRLFTYYEKALVYLHQCEKVFVFITGDMVNSDRRIGEITGNEMSRGEVAIHAAILIEDFLLHLTEWLPIHVASVSGNESRINLIHGHEDYLMKDNFDYIIYKQLEAMLSDKPNITFENIEYYGEHIVKVGKQNVLLMHGDSLNKGDVDKAIQNVIGKYARRKILVDFVLYGHLHSAMISDFYARGSSLVGSNEYSDVTLNYASKASQNLHLFYENGNVDSIKIDLNVSGEKQFRY